MISAPLGRFVPKYSDLRYPATGLMGKDQPLHGERDGERGSFNIPPLGFGHWYHKRVAKVLPGSWEGTDSAMSRWSLGGASAELRWSYGGVTVGIRLFSLFYRSSL